MEVPDVYVFCPADVSSHYLNYKALKKQIKSAQKPTEDATSKDETISPDLTGYYYHCSLLIIAFFYELDRNLESVDDFFSKKSAEMLRRLKLLIDKYGDSRSDQLDYHELEDLVPLFVYKLTIGWRVDGFTFTVAKVTGLRSPKDDLTNKWYADVNNRGFTKILKKYISLLKLLK